ncbi:hypothetical protein ACP70R_007878 [Stipagrostis hirtigluma subsp. patula]
MGFISIDCGYIAKPDYSDQKTGITYVSDVGFTDTGLIHSVNPENMQPDLADRYWNVRAFPNGTRNCYTLRSLRPGGKYYVRAAFGYGNYDKVNRLPTFDLYLGVNYWTTVSVINASTAYIFEMIAVSPANYLQVCLVNIGLGTPFISGLDLRSLQDNLYPYSNATQSLVLLSFFRETVGFGPNRYHFGTDYRHIRYPDDRYDRIWQRYEAVPTWTIISDAISGTVKNSPNDTFGAPSAVMHSVSTPVNASRMDLWWSSDSYISVEDDTKYFVVLYFAELENLQGNEFRQFDILLDNSTLVNAFTPEQMLTSVFTSTVRGSGPHGISLVATSNSKPPLISAMEIYLVRPLNESGTDIGDASAMLTIQSKFSVKRNWAGDPCSPKAFSWDGLNCTYAPSGPARIIALYLSSSGLIGEIDPSFGQLTLLQHLDLSHNNLSGPIPDSLGQVPSLTFLDLSSNSLSGSIPTSLLQKSQDGLLTLRVDNNPNLCVNRTCDPNPHPKKPKAILVAEIAIPITGIILIVALGLLAAWWKRRKVPGLRRATNPFENRRFKYKELKVITCDFKKTIGKGGFGFVYAGKLENGTPVAVKMRSPTSSQGNNEFLSEARHLAKVHHKNLVSLIGYCKDRKNLGLVYEYMDGGNLYDRLRGEEASLSDPPLNWLQRLKIALDSAYGLEYLHKSCNPPLIHRDVKATNILLTTNLEAKISDFGLTRAFSSETNTHTPPPNRLVLLDTWTLYYTTHRLSEKSDVYSFGVVLLVLITAKPVIIIINESERTFIVNWVRERLDEGDIESVTDSAIRGDCDVNSVRKVAELALHCTKLVGRDRPTMTEIVEVLRDSLQQETSSRSMRCNSIGTSGSAAGDAESIGVLETQQIGETLSR